MSGSLPPEPPPPEVPEEFAAAYRAAYEQAMAAQSDGAQHRQVPYADGLPDPDGNAEADELPLRRGPIRVGTHRTTTDESYEDDAPTWFEGVRDSAWFVPLLLGLLALLLILGAYSVGRKFSGQVANDAPDPETGIVLGEGGTGDGKQSVTQQKAGANAWRGPVARLVGVRASAGCTSKAGLDASGKKVGYAASNLTDGVADTTWRCNGPAIGERIMLDLGKQVSIGQVGLIPGYAKTDEKTGADRFAENNRVTRARWIIGDTEVIQRMSGKPDDRSLQLLRVPRTTTDKVELEILAVAKGPRDTTAISEIELSRAK